MPSWLHCNFCHNRQTRSWHVSSCGKVVCQNCLPRIRTTMCGYCQGPCTKTVELNSKAPEDVQRLFRDVVDEVKKVGKIFDFQEKHQAKFLLAKKKQVKKLAEARSAAKREIRKKLAEKAEVKKKLASLMLQADRKKRAVKSDTRGKSSGPLQTLRNAATAVSSLFRMDEDAPMAPPPDFRPPTSPIISPRSEPRGPAFITSTPAHIRQQTLDREFMELRTPAPLRKSQGGRREEAGRSQDRSQDRSLDHIRREGRSSLDCTRKEEADRRSLDRIRMEKPDRRSPVMKQLDKLLENPRKGMDRVYGRNYSPRF